MGSKKQPESKVIRQGDWGRDVNVFSGTKQFFLFTSNTNDRGKAQKNPDLTKCQGTGEMSSL